VRLKSGKSLLIPALMLAAAAWWAKGRFFTPITNARPRGSQIIAFGDSLTAGQGVAPGERFVSLLSKEFGVPILNAGVSGDTTASALERLDGDVLRRDPKVVILELGGNDLLQQVPHAATERNLAAMIARTQERGAAVVLVAVGGPLGIGGMGPVYRRLAAKYHTALVKNILSGILGDPELMADQIHPNAAGHRIIAQRIAKELRRAVPTLERISP